MIRAGNLLSSCLLSALVFGLVSPQPAPAQESAVIEEILVTARKRSEDLQNTPVSVTALSADLIEQARLLDIKDIENLTPNLNFVVSADGSGSTLQAFIRGVGQFDFAVTTDPGVGVYIDGVYLARTIGANLEFADIERVEVLRGPQGTLFGKNTIGGAINVVTREPTGETNYSAQVSAGETGYTAFDGYVEFPISDQVVGSLSLLWKESDGWQKRNRGDAGDDDMWGLRGHLSWDVSEDWNSHLVVDTVDQDQNVYPRVLSHFDPEQFFPSLYNAFVLGPIGESCCATNSNDIDRSGVLNREDTDELETVGLSWINTWNIGNLQLKSVTGYRDMEAVTYRDSDNQTQNYFSVGTGFDTDQLSQEFLLSNTGESNFDWTVGAYYFNEDANHTTSVSVAEGLFEALSALPNFITTPDGIPLNLLAVPLDVTLDYDRSQEITSYAAFFSTTFHFSARLRLNLGARYTYEEKDLDTFTLKRASQTPIALPGPSPTPECSAVAPLGNGSVFNCNEDWNAFSPKVGFDYNFSDDILGYTHVARGFKSGVFNGRPLATEEISVADPETVTSYEVGFKSRLLDQRLQLNGAVFYNDYEDQQQLVNTTTADVAAGLVLTVENAAESSLTGAELEFTALPGAGFTIMGGLAWLDAEFDKFEQTNFATGNADDLSAREFRDAPEWSANLMVQYDYSFQNGGKLRIRGDLAYKDDIFYTNDEAASTFDDLHADGFTTYNAGITYITPAGNWEIGAYGRNLGDEREIIGGFVVDAFGSTDVAFTEPRRYFVSVRYSGGTGH